MSSEDDADEKKQSKTSLGTVISKGGKRLPNKKPSGVELFTRTMQIFCVNFERTTGLDRARKCSSFKSDDFFEFATIEHLIGF